MARRDSRSRAVAGERNPVGHSLGVAAGEVDMQVAEDTVMDAMAAVRGRSHTAVRCSCGGPSYKFESSSPG